MPSPDGFRYTSDSNSLWLTSEELQELIAAVAPKLTQFADASFAAEDN